MSRTLNQDVPGYVDDEDVWRERIWENLREERRKQNGPPKPSANGSVFHDLDALGLTSAADLQLKEFPPLKWAIPDLVPEGLTILAGRPKFGKSWLGLDFAIAAADGKNALGSIPCKAGPVLYLALEDTDRRSHARINNLLQGRPWPQELELKWKWERSDHGGLKMLRTWLQVHSKEDAARLVIIDTLQKVRGERAKNKGVYEDDYQAVADFKALADEFRVPILLLHHENKTGNTDHVMAVSGTAGLTGAADTIISLNRKSRTDPNATLEVTGRDVISDEIAIQQDMETGQWVKLGKADDFRLSEGRRQIVRALTDHAGQMTPKELSEITGQKRDNTRYFLTKMVSAGEVKRHTNGKYSF